MKVKFALFALLMAVGVGCVRKEDEEVRPLAYYMEFRVFNTEWENGTVLHEQFNTALRGEVFYFTMDTPDADILSHFGWQSNDLNWNSHTGEQDETITVQNNVGPAGYSSAPLGSFLRYFRSNMKAVVVWHFTQVAPTARVQDRMFLGFYPDPDNGNDNQEIEVNADSAGL